MIRQSKEHERMERKLKVHVDPIESYFVKLEEVLENVIALGDGSNFSSSIDCL